MAAGSGTAGGNWIAGFGSLGVVRQLGLMVGLAASVAIGFAIVLWSQKPEYSVLYSNIDFADANTAIDQLNLYSIPYTFDTSGRAILVPADRVHEARLKLAAEGFVADKTVGFELMDQSQGLASSQFLENARYRRGLEGELARTISSLLAVRSARVHLAIPKESVFIRDQRKPRASVFLELFSGRQLGADQVAAIANLVASSIAELDVRDVTVVDQRGRLLNTREKDQDVVLAARQLEYSRSVEETLLNRVNSMLQPIVGIDRFRAEVSADVDFTQVEQADETYNPDLPALRSEQVMQENRASNTAAGGVPGALTNQPPGVANAPQVAQNGANGTASVAGNTGTGSSREQSVKNYELDRSVSYTRHQQGRVSRLTVAVVVDDIVTTDENGNQTRTVWAPEDLNRLRVLVENAVGYKAVRGDSVTVLNSSFIEEAPVVVPEAAIWEQDWIWEVARQVAAAAFVLILVFGVLRPIMRSLADATSGGDFAAAGPAGDISAELDGLDDSHSDRVTFGGSGGMMPTPNESYDYQVNTIRSMVAEDPAKVAQAVKQWVAERE